ncbi:Inner membrane metabolite transport protein YhjE [Beijerinckiaceae bacterium RH AL1]|nr:Inner membrane metabolite transport protein YhjE [Beijerinckiaceae bacterium RH AL8]VVB43281.1 Inner membrane metabolite transport protein YhjE [Beijerinckiaceae bacterium RH CH11]VVC53754.1 Inner membrane metabolite transport protein YhjE [Beijerinckiaceae bacterium RH AL1]
MSYKTFVGAAPETPTTVAMPTSFDPALVDTTAVAADIAAGSHPFVGARRALAASLVGTAIEFYDFYVYATAASLVLGAHFFPASSPSAQLLAAYGSFGLAFIARPLGAVVFGHFGDRIGRKSTLVASLVTMGASTVLIGALPTYQAIGWLAPLLLCLLRFGQGFGLGGEWGGAALLAVENAPPGYSARFGMFPQLGAPVGFIAANGFFLLLGVTLTPAQFASWGWRLPFLASVLLVGLGLWVRLRLTETRAFAAARAAEPPPDVPLSEVLREHPAATIAGTFAVVVCFALFYLTTAFALGYGTGTLHYDKRTFLGVQIAAILGLALGIVVAGAWSDRTSPRRVLLVGCVASVGLAAALAPMLGSGSLPVVWLYLTLALFTMGFVYGPLGAFLPSLFPARVRYTGASLAFNLGGILGGGVAPFAAQALAEHGGLALVGVYLATMAGLSLCGLLATRPPRASTRQDNS